MDATTWSRLARESFDPQRTLRGEDLALFVDRPDRQLQRVLSELNDEPDGTRKFFLTGTTGAGKSSELAEIGRLHWDTWAVIPIDVQASAANVNEVTGVEVLLMIGLGAIRAAGWFGIPVDASRQAALIAAFKRVAKDPERVDAERLVRGLSTFVVSAALTANGLPAAGGVATGLAEAAGAVAHRFTRPFGGLARAVADSDPEVESLAEAVSGILADVRVHRRPLVLVDGLDRIERPDAIRSVFVQNRLLDLPTCPVLYAGPISLWADPDYRAIVGTARFLDCPLANLPVQRPVPGFTTISEERVTGGFDTLRQVVARRLERAGTTSEVVFAPRVLDRLVEASGGVIRDLVGLVQEAMKRVSWMDPTPARIEMPVAEDAIREKQGSFEPGLTNQQAVAELQAVEDTGQPTGTELSARLLLRGAILGYRNGRLYFRVHPLARSVLPPRSL